MADYILTEPAQIDLEDIYDYIERDSGSNAAYHVVSAIYAGIDDLVRLPAMGHRRPDVIAGDYLFHGVFRYQIVFRRRDRVVILRVIHGTRDLPRRL